MPPTKLERMRAVCAADPTNAFAWYSLAMELRKTDADEALRTFEKVAREHPDYVATYYQHAELLKNAGETARAKEIYRAGIAAARRAGDGHALGELEAALDQLD